MSAFLNRQYFFNHVHYSGIRDFTVTYEWNRQPFKMLKLCAIIKPSNYLLHYNLIFLDSQLSEECIIFTMWCLNVYFFLCNFLMANAIGLITMNIEYEIFHEGRQSIAALTYIRQILGKISFQSSDRKTTYLLTGGWLEPREDNLPGHHFFFLKLYIFLMFKLGFLFAVRPLFLQ